MTSGGKEGSRPYRRVCSTNYSDLKKDHSDVINFYTLQASLSKVLRLRREKYIGE